MNFTWREILLAPFYAVQFIYYRFCDWWAGYPPVE